jgi:hypothetical protein
MVTLDRIRLTGLLRKTPAHVGVFYMASAGEIVIRSRWRRLSAVSLEPLGAGACAGAERLLAQGAEERDRAPRLRGAGVLTTPTRIRWRLFAGPAGH